MTKIENARGRDKATGPSGYERLFGIPELGQLLSKCQATIISSGNELERLIENKIQKKDGIAIGKLNKKRRLFKNAKKDENGKYHDIRIDIVIEQGGKIKLIELKDGDVFDVKKVAGEVSSLTLVKKLLIDHGEYTEKDISIHFCSFNQTNKESIYRGAKNLLPQGAAMSGKELCDLLGIDYEGIINERKGEQPANLDYFLGELVKIPKVEGILSKLLKTR